MMYCLFNTFAGSTQVLPDTRVILRQRSTCECPQMEQLADEGITQFFIYGKDEAKVEDDDGKT